MKIIGKIANNGHCKRISKGKKGKFGMFLILFIIISNIFSVTAFPGPFQGGNIVNIDSLGYRGHYNPENGNVQYIFKNNVKVNITYNIELELDIEISDKVENKYCGLIGTSTSYETNTEFRLLINSTYKVPAKGRSRFYNVPGNIPENPYKPFSSDFPAIIGQIDAGSESETQDYEISPYDDFYITLYFEDSIDQLTFFYDLSTHEEFDSLSKNEISWAYYNPQTGIWELLNSSIEGTILYVSLDQDIASSILSSNEITIAPVIINPSASIWESPTFIIIITVILVVAILFAIAMTSQQYRTYLVNRVIPIKKGVHRNLEIEDVIENENRKKIIDFILENPGAHFNQIQQSLNISPGNLVWHLDVLETFKVIRKVRVGHFITFFPYFENNPISKLDLKLQKSKTTLEVLKLIEENPGIYQNQIAKRLSLDHKTVKYHLDKLVEAGIIRSDNKKRKKGFYLKNDVEPEESSKKDNNM